ncbi:dihydrodipicolinate synthase family protein [Bacillus massiliglaciei]|uniref:dihydrodipicolinate synthase family protein n=1 Tax=Bacillus massiliglaciei TaxID=1816693 RepID=UPI0018FE1596|nr:dihydrodipicolinate synthase family protein [Bacillus massiliglaciei]
MLKEDFHVAVPTAFFEDESLNIQGTVQHIKNLYRQGVRSVLVCGSTGEQHSLTLNEKLEILQALEAEDELMTNMEIIFGLSSIRQKEAEELAKQIRSTNIAGVLLGFPPYVLPTQAEALVYAEKLIELTEKPTILYNNPLRTGFHLSIESMIQLSRLDFVIGLKEAGEKERVITLRREIPDDPFFFYAGGEMDLAAKIELGFTRLSSISGNVYPKEIKSWFHKLLMDQALTGSEEEEAARMIKQIFTGSPLVNLKMMIKGLGVCRSPLGNNQ